MSKKSNQRKLKEEFLKELLSSIPKEVLESLEEDIKEALGQEDTRLSQEEEFELIERMEKTVITYVMEKGEDLSPNGLLLIMFKLLVGIEEALKDVLSEEEFKMYKATVKDSAKLREEHEQEVREMIKNKEKDFYKKCYNHFTGEK